MNNDKTALIDINFNDFKNEKWKSCIIIEGDQIGKVFNLIKQQNIIGRVEDADITLDSPTVSRRHAEIIIQDQNSMLIKDLNSSNGTYVNGNKITETELHEGDIFSIGLYKLKVASLSKDDTAFFQRMMDNAEKDTLTGTYNKGFITRLLETITTQSGHSKRLVSIAMVDIDRFKSINDTYGHIAGDTVLKDIAGLLSTHLRAVDKFGRFGGEEFLIIFDRTSLNDARVISERIRKMVMEHKTLYGGQDIKVTISIGLASNEDKQIQNAESFIKLADEYLYTAKKNGRNQVVS
jgi:diguanylate cyclase (GGDEF)-like protein